MTPPAERRSHVGLREVVLLEQYHFAGTHDFKTCASQLSEEFFTRDPRESLQRRRLACEWDLDAFEPRTDIARRYIEALLCQVIQAKADRVMGVGNRLVQRVALSDHAGQCWDDDGVSAGLCIRLKHNGEASSFGHVGDLDLSANLFLQALRSLQKIHA